MQCRYTAVGGKDIASGHACAALGQGLSVTCDGRPVAVPPDVEGLLVLNINSYMVRWGVWGVGVNWGAGVNRPSSRSLQLVVVWSLGASLDSSQDPWGSSLCPCLLGLPALLGGHIFMC